MCKAIYNSLTKFYYLLSNIYYKFNKLKDMEI